VNDPYLRRASPYEANLFFTAYAVWLATGHTILSITIKSGTLTGYLKAAADTVQNGRKAHQPALEYPDPRISISTGNTCVGIDLVKKELKRWENLPNRRHPLTKGMITRLAVLVDTTRLFDLYYVLLDWFVLGLHTGFRLSEYAQRNSVTRLQQVARISTNQRPTALLVEDFKFFRHNHYVMSHDEAIASPE
jgi:hypothetical protein